MMCASSDNSLKALWRDLTVGVCLVGCLTVCVGVPAGYAASAYSAPQSGLEGGMRHSYGPDSEGKRDKRYTMSMPNDAYGNPITPMEEPERKRTRMRPGAYGGGKSAEAPLPDLPERDAGWNFK